MESTAWDATTLTTRRTTTFLAALLVALCSGTIYVRNLMLDAILATTEEFQNLSGLFRCALSTSTQRGDTRREITKLI